MQKKEFLKEIDLNVRDDTILLNDLNIFNLKKNTRGFTPFFGFLHSHIRRGFIIIASALDKNRSAFPQGTRPLKDPTKNAKKTTQEA